MIGWAGIRRQGPSVRLYSRNANDLTARLPAIEAAAEQIKAKSFTIDGEAVVLGPDGLSRFEELRRRSAAQGAILYAFDLIEHNGEDLRNLPFLDRKAALARLLRDTEAGILLTAHGFGASLIAGLVNHGLVTLTHEKVRAGGKTVEVAKVRITEKGRDALRES